MIDDATSPPHPGEMLSRCLEDIGISASAMAMELKVPTNRITMVLSGQRSISPDTALRLAHYFSGDPNYWLDLQRDYDLALARRKAWDKIQQSVIPRINR